MDFVGGSPMRTHMLSSLQVIMCAGLIFDPSFIKGPDKTLSGIPRKYGEAAVLLHDAYHNEDGIGIVVQDFAVLMEA